MKQPQVDELKRVAEKIMGRKWDEATGEERKESMYRAIKARKTSE